MSEHENESDQPARSFDEILAELLSSKGGNTDGAGAIYLDNDGIHGRLPENVRKTLLAALERNKSGKGRRSMIRREAIRASRDVVTMLRAQLISRCELLERTAEWTEAEAVMFVEIATAASCARLKEEVAHHAAIDGYSSDGKNLLDLSADEYLALVEDADLDAQGRVASVLSRGRRNHERLERYTGVIQALSAPD